MGNAIPASALIRGGDARQSRWFRRRLAPSAKVRLFCLPYAGGSAWIYRNWHDWLAPDVEVAAVELPGRGAHMHSAPLDHMDVLIHKVLAAMRPLLDRPFALFGHSMGGLLAFELCRALARKGPAKPVHLFVSGIEAPDLFACATTLHDLPRRELVTELRRFNEGAAHALQDDELADVLLPMVRADFRVAETYSYVPGDPLPVPITVFGGLEDVTTPAALEAWSRHTALRCMVRLLPGDHFFIHEHEHLMAASVGHCLHPAGARP